MTEPLRLNSGPLNRQLLDWDASEIARTREDLAFAKIRCTPTLVLFRRLRCFDQEVVDPAVAAHVATLDLTSRQKRQLASVLIHLARCCCGIQGQRAKLDRIIHRLAPSLFRADSRRLAFELVVSARRSRRLVGYRIYRRHGLPRSGVLTIQQAWRIKGDIEALQLLAMTRKGLDALPIEDVLDALRDASMDWIGDSSSAYGDHYWQARAIERFIVDNEVALAEFQQRWPFALLRAIGRLSDPRLAGFVVATARQVNSPRAFSLAASVLGRLGSKRAVRQIEALFEKGAQSLGGESDADPGAGFQGEEVTSVQPRAQGPTA